tara:strand:- start:129 stop:572 length:444 start_codon:yes stop_codon:yes gene_type:complete
MWAGVLVIGWGLWLLGSGRKGNPDGVKGKMFFTEWVEVERTPFVEYKLNPNPDGYYCIEQRDRKEIQEGSSDEILLFSQWRVQIKGTDNDYTVSTIYNSLADAQAKVASMNKKPTKEDYDLAEEKGLLPDDRSKENEVFITPTFGGK